MLGILVTLLLYFYLISWIAYWKKGSEEDYYQVKKAVPVTVLAFLSLCDLTQPHFLSDSGRKCLYRQVLSLVCPVWHLSSHSTRSSLFSAPLSKGKL